MATNENLIPIPGRLHSVATEGHVAGADQIIDDETGLTLDKVAGGALEEKEYTSGSDNGMGRVVLRKNLVNGVNTLVQTIINKSNTIYIIQYDFTLGEDITIPANCVLEFDGGSIDCDEYEIILSDADIISPQTHIFKNIHLGDIYKKHFNAVWAGLFADAYDNSVILNYLITKIAFIYIPEGIYNIRNTVTIADDAAVLKIYGDYSQKNVVSRLMVYGCHGIVVQKSRITISDIQLYGNNCIGIWSSEDNKYNNGYYGIDIQAGCSILNCFIDQFAIGIYIAHPTKHVVTCTIKRTYFSYCSNIGLYIHHYPNGQKNQILVEQCYFAKCGHGVDTPTADSTELYSGHGCQIKGGKNIELNNCVFEWCSGVGLYIEGTNENESLIGFTAICNYYERNKYTQAYYTLRGGNLSLANFVVTGSFFENYQGELPPNASPKRNYIIDDYDLSVFHANAIIAGRGNSINIEGFDYSARANESFNDSKYLNAFIQSGETYDDEGYAVYSRAFDDGRTRVTLKPGIYTLNIMVKYKATQNYNNVNYSIKNTGSTINTSVYIPNNKEGSIIESYNLVFNEYKYNVYAGTIYLNRALVNDEYIKVKFEWREATMADTSTIIAFETPYYGMTLYNKTTNKQVMYNGSKWINVADGSDMPIS